MYTTLNAIRKHQPCTDGWEKLLKHLGKTKPDDEPLSLLTVLESNGLDHALWCFRAVEGFEKEKLLLGIGFAREVEHLMPAESKKALDVFERYASGLASQEEFETSRWAATDASYAAWSAAAFRAAAFRVAVAHAARAAAARAAAAADAAYAAAAAAAAARAAAAANADAAARAAAAWADAAWADVAAAAAAANAYSTIKAKQETQLRQLLKDSAKGES